MPCHQPQTKRPVTLALGNEAFGPKYASKHKTVRILHLQLVLNELFSSDWLLDTGIIITYHGWPMQLVGVEQIIIIAVFPDVGVGGHNSNSLGWRV